MTREAGYAAVVIGASAGGTNALQQILPRLPADFPLPIVIAQHLHPLQDGAAVIHYSGGSALTVKDADEKEAIRPGFVYFAPPNYHLLIEADHTFGLSIDPKVHFTRPSVDVLFESAADAYGTGLIGIVLSGANEDGAMGLRYLQRRGGLAIVQDPADAEVNLMPRAAIESAQPRHVLPASRIAAFLVELTRASRG
jgi:two-component system chemotaxis response regulator CheB